MHKFEFEIGAAESKREEKLRDESRMTVFEEDLYVAERPTGETPTVVSNTRVDQWHGPWGESSYGFSAQLPEEQLSELNAGDQGIAFGTATGETEMYLGFRKNPGGAAGGGVAVFNEGPCGTLECATHQANWTGVHVPGGPFGTNEVHDVAVDEFTGSPDWAKGDVFVATPHAIDIFKPVSGGGEPSDVEAQLTGVSPTEQFFFVERVSVSGFNGDLVVKDGSVVDLFKPTTQGKYEFLMKLMPEGKPFNGVVEDVAVDAGSGEIYVATQLAVYEFSSIGGFEGDFTGLEHNGKFISFDEKNGTEQNPRPDRPHSITVDPTSHNVFVGVESSQGESVAGVDVFGPDVVIPDPSTLVVSNTEFESGGVGGWGVRLTGDVDPDNAGPATCWFVWGRSPSFGLLESCFGEGESFERPVENGVSPVEVHTNLGGLEPDTTYYYRLQAKNGEGTNFGKESQDKHFRTPGPGLASDSVSRVSDSGAKLEASIEPHDAPVPGEEQDLQEVTKTPTTYFFEYGKESCGNSGVSCSPVPGTPVAIESGVTTAQVTLPLEGLEPNTTYHYRVVADSEALPASKPGVIDQFRGQERTFKTQGVGSPLVLLDGRSWELVSPVDLRGGVIFPPGSEGAQQVSADGTGVTYQTTAAIEDEPAGNGSGQVLSLRGEDGWGSKDIALPHGVATGGAAGDGGEYKFFSEDLSESVVESFGPFSRPCVQGENNGQLCLDSPSATERTPLLRHNLSCESELMTCYEPLLTGTEEFSDVEEGVHFGGDPKEALGAVTFVGATPDAEHVVLNAEIALERGSSVAHVLYEWSADAPAPDRLQPVSVLPNDGGLATHSVLGTRTDSSPQDRRTISDDGSRVVFSSGGALYARDARLGVSLRLDVAQGGSGVSSNPVFQVATPDGSKVFFTDGKQLTVDGATSRSDLYECNIEVVGDELSCVLSDLTPVPKEGSPGAGESADVLGEIPGVSENGEYVYFVANGVQAAGASPGDCGKAPAASATCNLYVEHDGVTSLVAVLSGDDSPDWDLFAGHMTSRVSGNGEWLAFMSDKSLTGYDNRDLSSGKPDEEVYLFDATRPVSVGKPGVPDNPVCVSCNPSGGRPAGVEYSVLNKGIVGGDRVWPEGQWVAGSVPGWKPYELNDAVYQPRYLSSEGRVFFDSSDGLVSQDTNGEEDVYEFEPVGTGDCSESSSLFVVGDGGCVGLVSSGVARGESGFFDASVTGDDVFFLTSGGLVSEDVDGSLSLYDAHVCSVAVPCPPLRELERSECGSAEECRPGSVGQPSVFGAPASATLTGIVSSGPLVSKPVPVPKKVETRAEKLRKALLVCARKPRRARSACQRRARRLYGPVGKQKPVGKSKGRKASGGRVAHGQKG